MMKRMVGWVRWFDNDDDEGRIPSLSVAVFCFSFFLAFFLSFVLSFPFSCTHPGGEKRFHGVYTLTREM